MTANPIGQAARRARRIADEFAKEADGAKLQQVLPILAARMKRSGASVTARFLRAAARRGPDHVGRLAQQFVAGRDAPPRNYDAILAGWRRTPFDALLDGKADPDRLIAAGADISAFAVAAIERGRTNWIRAFARDPRFLMPWDEVLLHAAKSGQTPVARLAAPHAAPEVKKSALRWAISRGDLPLIVDLHERHGVPFPKRDPVLACPTFYGHLHVMDYMRTRGVDTGMTLNRTLTTALINGQTDVIAYLYEHDQTVEKDMSLPPDKRFVQWLTGIVRVVTPEGETITIDGPVWEKFQAVGDRLRGVSGLESPSPDPAFHQTAAAARRVLRAEGYGALLADPLSLDIAALFGTEDRLWRYFEKWGKPGIQPLHDITYRIRLPAVPACDMRAWGDALLEHGPAMAPFTKFTDRLSHPLPTVRQTREAARAFAYTRAGEHPALADICFKHDIPEWAFNTALLIDLLRRDQNLPAKTIPAFDIPGASFGMPGARFVKLGDDDPRALFLGEYTDCCQSVGGAGGTCVAHGVLEPDSGFYVVLSKKNEIIGQSWAWRGQAGELVLDSLETLGRRIRPAQWRRILQAAAKSLEADNPLGVTGLYVGSGGRTPKNLGPTADNPASLPNPRLYTDAQSQYRLWTAKPEKTAPGPATGLSPPPVLSL